jgi:hypothetical protein
MGKDTQKIVDKLMKCGKKIKNCGFIHSKKPKAKP